MFFPALQNIRIDTIKNLYQPDNIQVDILRLDLIHDIISGNKWFKLKEYLKQAKTSGINTILTYGGAYSNHIIATAAACNESHLMSVGIIRGEKPQQVSHTLSDAVNLGMRLFHVSREDYRFKSIPAAVWNEFIPAETMIINEGGYGIPGREGAETIIDYVKADNYSHIITAVGTGTTLAGIVTAAPGTEVIGISVMKNNLTLQEEINNLLPSELTNKFTLLHDYHFGGYAKKTPELLNFMNKWYEITRIPSDFVYTGKLFFAVDALIRSGHFPAGSKLLIIHSGGLQGNKSLPKGTLIFG